MPERGLKKHAAHFLLAAALFLLASCSQFEKLSRPLSHRVDSRVAQEEVVRIDKQIYVKVPNLEAETEDAYGRYRYVPIEEYLANREAYDAAVLSVSAPEEEEWKPVEVDALPAPPTDQPAESQEVTTSKRFKKRLMLGPFRDLANPSYNQLSEVVRQRLASTIQGMWHPVIVFDTGVLQEMTAANTKGIGLFDPAEMARMANQSYGIHAIVTGTIDHIFVSSTDSPVKGKQKRAYAIAEVKAQLIDAQSGEVRNSWKKRNSIFDSEDKGEFSEEKARLNAIGLIVSELAPEIIEELKTIDWYTRIADVDEDHVYISAGKRSGVRVGDTFSVYPPNVPNEPKGEVRVANLFGIDASVADVTRGRGFRANDFVKPVSK